MARIVSRHRNGAPGIAALPWPASWQAHPDPDTLIAKTRDAMATLDVATASLQSWIDRHRATLERLDAEIGEARP